MFQPCFFFLCLGCFPLSLLVIHVLLTKWNNAEVKILITLINRASLFSLFTLRRVNYFKFSRRKSKGKNFLSFIFFINFVEMQSFISSIVFWTFLYFKCYETVSLDNVRFKDISEGGAMYGRHFLSIYCLCSHLLFTFTDIFKNVFDTYQESLV